MKKLTRMESNKEVRRVLNRHHVDLAYCNFSCSGRDLLLTGWLCKTDGTDFNGSQVYILIEDFQRKLPGYTITGDLDNWNFNSERITYVGERHTNTAEEKEQEVYEISLEDYDFDSEAS